MTKKELIEQVEKSVKTCKKCRLHENAINAVPGEGNINAELMFIGEAPGQNEDLQGRPFVGRAGKLLELNLEKIGMKREDVWIGNIIKHRPPENRNPLPDEIASCKKYLDLQLCAINPTLIVTLGRFSLNYFYPEGMISKDKGRLIEFEEFMIYPIYHPAAALRNPTMKLAFEKDFERIPEILKEVKKIRETNSDPSYSIQQKNDGQLGLKI